jgi:hypothetical protein
VIPRDLFARVPDDCPATVAELRAVVRYRMAVQRLHALGRLLIVSDVPEFSEHGERLLRFLRDPKARLEHLLDVKPPRGRHRIIVDEDKPPDCALRCAATKNRDG